MKYIAWIMVVLLVASLFGVGYVYLTATLQIESVSVIAMEAAAQPELFESLRLQQRDGLIQGTAYTDEPFAGPENYQFYTYTVRLNNNCFLTADMVEVQVTPMDGDVLQVGDAVPRSLAAHAAGDIQATILTAMGMHAVREINVTYYMWGIPFFLRTTYGQ